MKTWWQPLVVLGVALVSNSVDAQRPDAAPVSGRLTKLPEQPGQPQFGVLDGHLRLLGKTLNQAIDDLQQGDLKQFAESARRVVDAYGQVADVVGDAAEATGNAAARMSLSRKCLHDLAAHSAEDPLRRRELTDNIEQLRSLTLTKLREARDRYDHAADDQQRKKLLQTIDGLLRRATQLSKLNAALAKGSQPLLPGLTSEQVGRQLDDFDAALAEETKALELVAESSRLLVETTAHDMRHTIRLLAIEAQLPAEQMRQLAELRQTIEGTLEDLTRAHETAASSALELLAASPAYETPADPQEVLRRADQLLGRSPGSQPMGEDLLK